MRNPQLIQDQAIAVQLHAVLSDIDQVRWRDERAPVLLDQLKDVMGKMGDSPRLEPLRTALEHEVPALLEDPTEAPRSRWMAFKRRLQPVYARVAAALRAEAVVVPSLRPTNHLRSLTHLGSAVLALLIIELVPWPWPVRLTALAFSAACWSMELARRLDPRVNARLMRFFAPIAHPHEARAVNSATWFSTALVLLALTGEPAICAAAVAVLGVADPLAGLVGRRFGRTRLTHGRSLEGTLTFLVTGFAAALAVLLALHPLAVGPAVAIAFAAALAGAVAELVSIRVDDNLAIPLSAAAGGALALFLVG